MNFFLGALRVNTLISVAAQQREITQQHHYHLILRTTMTCMTQGDSLPCISYQLAPQSLSLGSFSIHVSKLLKNDKCGQSGLVSSNLLSIRI